MHPETTSQEQGRWRMGQSGNPKGRPRGARNKATLAAEALLDGQAEALTRVCVQRALAGDSIALRLCLDRILAPRRDRHVRLAIPPISEAKDVPLVLTVILEAATAGMVTPDEGVRLAQVVEQVRKAIETAELEQRIAILEQRTGKQNETQA
jgi:hypothetical protein